MERALAHCDRAMTYMVSRRLNELFPGQSVIESYEHFDVDGFVKYGNGDASMAERISPQVYATWDGEARSLRRHLMTSWIEVEWRGEKFQVVRAPKHKCGWVHWVVGSETSVDAFMCAVHAFSSERSPSTHVYSGWWNESESFDRAIRESRWGEMVLPAELKKTIETQMFGFFDAKADYEMLGVPWKRGLLLTGPPGNGKTFLIRAILNLLPVPRLVVKSFGDDPEDVQEVFDKVRQLAPCVLVLEDIDSLIRKELLSSVLNALDGAEPLTGVLILATTNHPEKLDPAIRNRPSRFDRIVEFGPPAFAERRKLLRELLSRIPKELRLSECQLRSLARSADGFSYAYLKELAVSSTVQWMRKKPCNGIFEVAQEIVSELKQNMQTAEPGEKVTEVAE